jgi:hypothetical protein
MDLADYLPAEALVEGRGPRRKLPVKLLWVRLVPLLPLAVIYSASTLRHPLVDSRWLVVGAVVVPIFAMGVYVQLRKGAVEASRSLGSPEGVGIAVWAPSRTGNWDFWALAGTDLIAPDGSRRSVGEYRFVRASPKTPVRWVDVDGCCRPVRTFIRGVAA